jgi:MSHA pilin protein MshD
MIKKGNHKNNKQLQPSKKSHRGFSLVEMVVFIVIVTTAIAGVIGALAFMSGHSADPLARKQAIAIAESLMQEIQQMPFTFCDPDDPNASTANSAADCTTSQANLGGPSPAGESRYGAANPFDNVADYGGFTMPGGGCTGICRIGDCTDRLKCLFSFCCDCAGRRGRGFCRPSCRCRLADCRHCDWSCQHDNPSHGF